MSNLTDAQIRTALQSFGLDNIGPINAATRGAYLKKLERLQKSSKETNGAVAVGKGGDVSSNSQGHSSRSVGWLKLILDFSDYVSKLKFSNKT